MGLLVVKVSIKILLFWNGNLQSKYSDEPLGSIASTIFAERILTTRVHLQYLQLKHIGNYLYRTSISSIQNNDSIHNLQGYPFKRQPHKMSNTLK